MSTVDCKQTKQTNIVLVRNGKFPRRIMYGSALAFVSVKMMFRIVVLNGRYGHVAFIMCI